MKIINLVALVLLVLVVIGFFSPWVRVESEAIGQITKVLVGEKQRTVDRISGFRIPQMANGPDARLIISIAQIFKPGIKDVDKKSYAVWLTIVLAAVLFALIVLSQKIKLLNLLALVLGVGAYAAALYKISHVNLNKMVMNIKIDTGLWLILYAYLLFGILGLVNFVVGRARK